MSDIKAAHREQFGVRSRGSLILRLKPQSHAWSVEAIPNQFFHSSDDSQYGGLLRGPGVCPS